MYLRQFIVLSALLACAVATAYLRPVNDGIGIEVLTSDRPDATQDSDGTLATQEGITGNVNQAERGFVTQDQVDDGIVPNQLIDDNVYNGDRGYAFERTESAKLMPTHADAFDTTERDDVFDGSTDVEMLNMNIIEEDRKYVIQFPRMVRPRQRADFRLRYRIDLQPHDHEGGWRSWHHEVGPQEDHVTVILGEDLRPGSYYKCRHAVAILEFSGEVIDERTSQEVLKRAPCFQPSVVGNIKVSSLTADKVDVEWEPLRVDQIGCESLAYYKLIYTKIEESKMAAPVEAESNMAEYKMAISEKSTSHMAAPMHPESRMAASEKAESKMAAHMMGESKMVAHIMGESKMAAPRDVLSHHVVHLPTSSRASIPGVQCGCQYVLQLHAVNNWNLASASEPVTFITAPCEKKDFDSSDIGLGVLVCFLLVMYVAVLYHVKSTRIRLEQAQKRYNKVPEPEDQMSLLLNISTPIDEIKRPSSPKPL